MMLLFADSVYFIRDKAPHWFKAHALLWNQTPWHQILRLPPVISIVIYNLFLLSVSQHHNLENVGDNSA